MHIAHAKKLLVMACLELWHTGKPHYSATA